ncbi:MAG: transporter substrate-binding domain-containing protein [Reyranella sp.]|jgi:polar amino acid transport system substrate-binding protein|uniref:transporter substrate-binding domain-containing protein n=1 Tax=Reyranella sp. TaxID=1929291 RepID=UPI0025F33201|nr:transporter substrate-binding domain-containing protein [Reyranella sp.]MBR2820209.1 transporter substrate-binding domain-containing protein [Reyranella sp.]
MVDYSRRGIALGATVVAAGAGVLLAGRKAVAQQAKSTWEQVHQSKTLRMAAPISEPFCFKDLTNSDKPGAVKIGDITWRGVSVNICKELAEALGVQLQLVETTYGNGVAGLQANQFDLMFALDGTVKRAAVIDFVPQGIFMYGTAILAKAGTDIKTWKAINDQKLLIGLPVGTTMETETTRRAPEAKLDRFQNYNEMIAAFQAGRVQAISGSLTGMTLASARIPNSVVAMPDPPALFPATAAIRQDIDPRWRNFLTTSFAYLANSGFVQKALDEAYAFRGVDIAKLQPIVIR